MLNRICFCCVALLLSAILSSEAQAQQFRVYNRITQPQLDPDTGKTSDEVVARSLTLFHAGRVFDWLPSVGEVTVFEPAHKRFIIFNGRRMIATRVSFEEIERLLALARDEIGNYTKRESNGPAEQGIVEQLKFQLRPSFEKHFNPDAQLMKLTSPRFSYSAVGDAPRIPEALTTYLVYADWASRLNYVLHPRSVFPEPRLQLNQSLREHKLVPVTVQLRRGSVEQPEILQANHRFAWKFDSQDREHIKHWDSKLHDEDLEWVSFRKYQQNILQMAADARR